MHQDRERQTAPPAHSPDSDALPARAPALLGRQGEELVSAAGRARRADRALAGALNRSGARGKEASTGYLETLGRRPALEPAREQTLIRAAKHGDERARAELVEAFLPHISSIAQLYRDTPRVERLELLQEGVVGMLRALERYEPQAGTPFWSYAAWWVRQAMQRLIAEVTRPVILSDRALRQLARVRDVQRASFASGGPLPSTSEIAERTGIPSEHVESLLAIDRPPESLQQPPPAQDEGASTLGELIADPLAEDAYERVLDAIEIGELLALLAGLSERERRVVRARYGLDDREHSLAEIGARLGVSSERVRQLEQRALGKLRAAAREAGQQPAHPPVDGAMA
jgi:RNA polymerase primary sigma factor